MTSETATIINNTAIVDFFVISCSSFKFDGPEFFCDISNNFVRKLQSPRILSKKSGKYIR